MYELYQTLKWSVLVVFRVGFKIKQQMREEDLYKDRESQIAAIQATFDRAKDQVCSALCNSFSMVIKHTAAAVQR